MTSIRDIKSRHDEAQCEALSHQPPRIIVLSSPSGGGKTTQRELLMKNDPNREFLVSFTTRLPRPGEIDGKDYHFLVRPFLRMGLSPEESQQHAMATFQKLVDEGKILFEHTSFYGNQYGTSREQLERGLASDKQLIADVNLKGARTFEHAYPGQVCSIFLAPPSKEVVAERLRKRVDAFVNLSDEQRQSMYKDNARRLEQYHTVMNESRYYHHVVRQGDLMPEETHELVKRAIASNQHALKAFSRHESARFRSGQSGFAR